MAKVELEKKTSELKISVEAKKEQWQEFQDKTKKELIKNVSLPGFRKGHVPENMALKHVKEADVWHKAMPKILEVLIQEAAKSIDKDVIVLDSPYYNVMKLTSTELEVQFIYPVYPEIKISDYKNLKAKYSAPKKDNKNVEEELEKIRSMHSIAKTVSREAKNGDIIKFDFEGFVEGKPFEGGKAEGHELELGSGQFIPGFEEKLIGAKSGEEKDVNVTFPKEYHSEDLKGKDAIFKCKIHEIKEKELPELNDDLVKEVNVPNVKTIDELKSYIGEVMEKQAAEQARGEFREAAFKEIKENTELIIPATLVAKEMKTQEGRFLEQIKQQGLDKDMYLKMTGTDEAAFQSQMKLFAENSLKDSLIFAEISKLEKIELTDKDYEEEYQKLTKVYGKPIEEIKELIKKTQMQIPMTNEKVIDILIKENK